MMKFPIYGKIRNIPNHQPAMYYSYIGYILISKSNCSWLLNQVESHQIMVLSSMNPCQKPWAFQHVRWSWCDSWSGASDWGSHGTYEQNKEDGERNDPILSMFSQTISSLICLLHILEWDPYCLVHCGFAIFTYSLAMFNPCSMLFDAPPKILI